MAHPLLVAIRENANRTPDLPEVRDLYVASVLDPLPRQFHAELRPEVQAAFDRMVDEVRTQARDAATTEVADRVRPAEDAITRAAEEALYGWTIDHRPHGEVEHLPEETTDAMARAVATKVAALFGAGQQTRTPQTVDAIARTIDPDAFTGPAGFMAPGMETRRRQAREKAQQVAAIYEGGQEQP